MCADRKRTAFTYPPSPTSPSAPEHAAPLSQRLHALRAELASLEVEFADPANPLLLAGDADPGEMIRDLVNVRSRLERLSSRKEGRERFLELISIQTNTVPTPALAPEEHSMKIANGRRDIDNDMSTMAQMDKRVGELERIVGSSSKLVDEVRI